MNRPDGRKPNELRSVRFTLGVQEYAEGSVLIETGKTQVMCAVSIEKGVPKFLRGTGTGWVTAEYAMLPRSTLTRTRRETKTRGRTAEIQRLIGRSLRAAVDLEALGEQTISVDCDVLQADGGTRTASITGAYVALRLATQKLLEQQFLTNNPLTCALASTSVGLVNGRVVLDLNYEEDSQADADFNIVMTDQGQFVEVQGTAESGTFSKYTLDKVLATAESGIRQLLEFQQSVLDPA